VTVFVLGKIMRILLFILSLFVAGFAYARTLHVDNNIIQLSQTKTTDPALHVRIGDELWYPNMGRCQLPMNENTDKELKVKYNNTDYWVSDVEDYVIIDGKLIAANCGMYLLKSHNAMIIDTNWVANQDTSVFIRAYSEDKDVGYFGAREAQYKNSYGFMCTAGSGEHRSDYAQYEYSYGFDKGCIIGEIFSVYKNKNITTVIDKNDKKHIAIGTYTEFQTPYTLYLFGYHLSDAPFTATVNRQIHQKIYFVKIWDNDTLVRHFVPVPRGLQIGDFVVPSNGMWDIVEQKFYGNIGTGDFIYGVDE
jgi:hypothetical protein